jgi:hypothetical protein
LIEIRDEVWAKHKNLATRTVKRRYHALADLMRRQRDPSSRHHSATTSAYVRYLKAKPARKPVGTQLARDPTRNNKQHASRSSASGSAHAPGAGNDGVAIVYEPDATTFKELAQKSFLTGLSMHRLIHDAVLNSLR